MESYIHLYETNQEFTEAYNGHDYKEPWLSLTEENMEVNYNKPKLTAITFGTITWVKDVPATGGTATKGNCTFKVYAKYDNGISVDISSDATVTGTLVVPSSTAVQRHEIEQPLILTASYSGFTATGNVTVYQAAVDFSTEPLTFNILSDGTINWTASDSSVTKTIEYKVNNGEWKSITSNTGSSAPKINVNTDDKIQFRGNNATYSTSSSSYSTFSGSTSGFEVEGNIMSLINSTNFDTLTTLESNWTFAGLFSKCAELTSAKNLILPATVLTNYCYRQMFYNCTSLTTAPALPATTLAMGCYNMMFQGCASLTTATELPATTLANYCYYSMFAGCTSLTTAPSLPATTLEDDCYAYMFYGCTSLTTAPALPATTLAESCYADMFYGCTSLTTATELPATTLANYCYSNMFQGCTSLKTAPALPATTLTHQCYNSMFQGCTSLKTAPALPAKTLVYGCYSGMFKGCTSLTTAPELPANTLAMNCYSYMFSGCRSLTIAPELPATTLVTGCYNSMFNSCESLNYIKCLGENVWTGDNTSSWVYNVASTGTFVRYPNATWKTGDSGIPEGWTIQNA